MFFDRVRKRNTATAIFLATAALQSCGGSGDGSATTDANLTPGGAGAGAADDATVEVLLENAADSSITLSKNLDILQRMSDDDSDAMPEFTDEEEAFDAAGNRVDGFLRSTFGLGQPGARTTREGNIITVDPDDASVCEEEVPLTSLDSEQNSSLCEELVADLLVTVTAETEDSGLVTYLFQNEPVLLIGYAPNAANYEIKFPGVQRVVERSEALSNADREDTTRFAGSIRVGSVITDDQPGAEAGEVTVEIVDPVEIAEIDGPNSLTLGPSTVVAVAVDRGNDSATLSVDWGALTITSSSGDSDGNSSVSTIALAGLTGSATVSEAGTGLQVRNVGPGGVPVTITIDSVESASLGIDTFGFDLDSESGQLDMTGALGVNLAVNNLMGVLDDAFEPEFMADLQLAIPAGTSIIERDVGVLEVVEGGPVTSSLIASDTTDSLQQENRIDVGSCFELDGLSDDDAPLSIDQTREEEPETLTETVGTLLTQAECF